LKYPYTVTI